MAIAIRHGKGSAEAAREEELRAKAEQEMANAVRAAEEIQATREAFVATVQRLGKGGALWAERGWAFEAPDWEADPETWPPVAKILWLWARSQRHAHDASWRMIAPGKPGQCGNCGPIENPYLSVPCERHAGEMDVRTVQAMASALFPPGPVEVEEGDVIRHTQPGLELAVAS